ncbi:MAG: PEP/pyruvate-binding domain-containing protein [Anaerolineales bacterium]|jgi:hypothetical protein|nr:PEP/pyruvate-binding domain-containing protein [Anaerolineales bacterium]
MATMQIDQALADQMMAKALAACAEKCFGGDTALAAQALRQGRCETCSQVTEYLVQQVGETLGQIDHTVRAVYRYEPEYTAARPAVGLGRVPRRGGINLVTWVDRKSAALSALGATLETTLSTSRRKIGCPSASPACYTLDVEMVDSKDVLERRGYGAVVNSSYVSSTQVWVRPDITEQDSAVNSTLPNLEDQGLLAAYDPEMTPESVLFEQAQAIEKLPAAERAAIEHRLREVKVVLIRRMISDQLAYINIAKEWFTISDLTEIFQRKIGNGKIGGKAAGMLLAARILNEIADEPVRGALRIPESYFLGSDVVYLFMAMNGLMHWNDQKYKPENQIRQEYAQIKAEFETGKFPPEILKALQAILERIGRQPVIVRSSSQLEDNFGTAFAGKYDSHFCPNQGSPAENLAALCQAIARTYASTLKPEALLYRRSKGLQDYDERMAILIQVVQGEVFGRYYLPEAAGVAFSRNLYRWSPEIKREAGFARLVWGLGTRAVERVGNDYPRLVALSHPTLQPDDSCEAIRRYSQQYVDLIDLEENSFKSLPVTQVLKPNYPVLRFIAQIEQDGYFTTPRGRVMEAELPRLAITYDELLRRTPFPSLLSRMLRLLEDHYHEAVDLEFTVQIPDPRAVSPHVKITLLQCRPQSILKATRVIQIPQNLPVEQVAFQTRFMVPQGSVSGIQYVLFVPPEAYFALPCAAKRKELAGVIGQLNAALPGQPFICVGPGRWGTLNTDLGVYVSYADICNAEALVELSGKGIGPAPEPSLGTHFFQDLMEAQIFPLAICIDHPETIFNRAFFYDSPNCLADWIVCDPAMNACVRLIKVADFRPGAHLDLVMDDEQGLALAYFSRE